MAELVVSLDQVATTRQARRAQEPDPVQAALLAELAGASGIAVHLRADRRHTQDRDLEILRRVVKTRLVMEAAASQEMVRMALTVKPDQVTLVPERVEELTTEGGLDIVLNTVQLKPIVHTLQESGIQVCLLVDPDLEQVKEAHKLDAQVIEVSTAAYAEAADEPSRQKAHRKLQDAARLGHKLGLGVQAGHGLDYSNVQAIAALSEISVLRIGHSIVARALLVGMERAVGSMLAALKV